MVRELRVVSILTALDEIVELNPDDLGKGSRLLRNLDWHLEQLLETSRIDKERRKGLFKMVTLVRSSSSKFFQSLGNAKQNGQLRGDWLRFARNDF
ncbi:MAG: hypothetical protein QW786_02340, partial [Candidatus Hadarchaeum sp.]